MNNRILLIDDEPEILKALEMVLSQERYRVTSATRGAAALEIFSKQRFDLVITDMRMPGIDGIEVIRKVKELDPDVEVIVLTGYATLENAIMSLRNAGALDYLTKPLENIDELFMAVERALEKRRLSLENRALLQDLKKKEEGLARQNRALRESERKYRELADSLPIKLFETDAKGTVIFLNPFALDRLQYAQEDLEKGLQLQDVLGLKEWVSDPKGVQKMFAEESSDTMESVAKRKDGTTYPVLLSIHPIIEEDRLLGLRGFAIDITERKQRLEEMTRMAKLEALGTLAGGIAHDFNNLLSVILGNIELAKWHMTPDTPSARALDSAEDGCLAAKELTGQFITFSRGGAPELRLSSVDRLLRNTVPLSLSGSNVTCEYGIADDLYLVKLDGQQMGQVIHNLIRNAVEAMPEGGTVQVRAENVVVNAENQSVLPQMPEDRYVRLEIQDEGIGISEEHKPRVFDPYYSTKMRGSQKGMGLGLTTALSIVKRHGGFMLLESNEAVGTQVSICLPAVLEEREAEHRTLAVEPEGETPSKGPRILVMDDEALLREMAQQLLHLLGYEVETVSSGEEALNAYQKSLQTPEPFDLVLLDLTVKGGQGGREAIQGLRKLNPEVRAIVCSGYADDPVMSNCEAYGFRASLAKPFTKTSMEQALKKALALGHPYPDKRG